MHDAIFFTDETDSIKSMPPIGAYKLAMVLRHQGYKVLVVNLYSFFTKSEFYELVDMAVSSRTKLIGFSTTFLKSVDVEVSEHDPSPMYPELPTNTVFPQGRDFEDDIIGYIKRRYPQVKFCAGGTKVTDQYANKNIDYAILGYAEASIQNLMLHLDGKTTLTNSRRNLHGITVIDDKAAKGYDFVNERNIWLPEDVVNFRTLSMEVARGCIFQCKFCCYPMNGKHNLDFVRVPDMLQYELERNYEEYGITQYQLVDDTFNDHVGKLELLERTVDRLKFEPTFWATIRLDLVATRPQTIPILRNIGVRAMSFGIESMKPSTAKIIGKGFDRQRQNEALAILANDYPEIALHGLFIAGLPEETIDETLDTVERLRSGNIPLHSWFFQTLHIATSSQYIYMSDIDKNYEKYGYKANGYVREGRGINWSNDIWDYESCKEITNKINSESRASDGYHMSGIDSLNISGMGHSDYTFDKNRNTWIKNFDWNDVERRVRPEFVSNYKKQLFALLDK
jgi:radical SAM superfamily enzyme YgiQ (UPF0313 family)